MKIKDKWLRFQSKWGSGGIKRSIERKRARRSAAPMQTVAPNASQAKFPQCTPLPVFRVSENNKLQKRRISLVTDSINAGSLYGGVGTALILACELCRAHDASLRIVTRTEISESGRLQNALDLYGIQLPARCELVYCPPIGSSKILDVTENDIFITTSWWTTEATLKSVSSQNIRYLIQEDERMFYPHGDERLRCDAILQNPSIQLIVNSSLLHEHFLADNVLNYSERACFFEPSFPSSVYHPRPKRGKMSMFFYARPNNHRNLFHFGVDVLAEASRRGILDPDKIDILMVGHAIPSKGLLGGHPYKTLEGLKWSEYADLIGQVDVGFSLMYTPHPSYPPLDMAASGAIVLTNQYGNKLCLQRYSDAILCEPLDIESMVNGLKTAITRAESREPEARKRSIKTPETWQESLGDIVASFQFQ